MSHNTHDKASPYYQQGGTSILSMGYILKEKWTKELTNNTQYNITGNTLRGKRGDFTITIAAY